MVTRAVLLTGDPHWFEDLSEQLQPWVDVELVLIPPQRVAHAKLDVAISRILRELRFTPRAMRLLFRGRESVVLCPTNQIAVLIAGKLCRLIGRRPKIYLFHLYLFGQAHDFHRLGENRFVKRVLRYLLDQDVGLFLESPWDAEYFRQLAPQARISYYPFSAEDVSFVAEDDVSLGDFVFAGGFTNRDYALVIEAARRLEDAEFVLACASSNRLPDDVPPNVRVCRDVDRRAFHTLMAGARCVVVPLKENAGSSGLMVGLAAKQLGKAIVYADFPPIGQFFTDGEDGLAYRPGDADDLRARVANCLDDAAFAQAIGQKSHERFERDFRRSAFYARIADEVVEFARLRH